MIVSPYTFLYKNSNVYLIINLLTHTILQVDESIFSKLKDCRHKDISVPSMDSSIMEVLENYRIIVNSKKEEYDLCKSIIRTNRNVRNSVHITVAPTMDCCFSCPYCFEQQKNRVYMKSEMIDALVKYLVKNKEIQKIHLTWFGGEPLLAVDIMEEFYKKLKSQYNGIYESDLITTAFPVDERAISIIKEIEINEIQVTLDGKEDYHNSIKKSNNVNVFRKTLSNIDRLSSLNPILRIQIRINLSKNNEDEYVDLYNFLSKRYKNRPVSIVPGFIKNRNGCNVNCLFHNRKEIALFSLKMWHEYKIPTPWIFFDDTVAECAVRNPNSFVVGPDGSLYKCWEKIGDSKFKYGELTSEGDIDVKNRDVFQMYLNDKDPLKSVLCGKCKYLPDCFGGCPILRIETKHCKMSDLCSSHKGFMEEWISSYLNYLNYVY